MMERRNSLCMLIKSEFSICRDYHLEVQPNEVMDDFAYGEDDIRKLFVLFIII